MPNSHEFVLTVNELLARLEESGELRDGIEVANAIIRLLGTNDVNAADTVIDERVLQLPNAERYDHWFQNHPWMGGERAAFDITDAKDMPLQAKFYWLKKRSRQFIAGGVHFTENWEDADYTRNAGFKIGIDFFLAPNAKSLLVVLSNRGSLRIVELQHRLNNTQVDIFAKWRNANQMSSTEALHTTIWESFKLQSVNKDFYNGVSNSFTELLQHLKSIGRNEEDAKLFASRLLGRLLFVWFLRKKNIIDESMGYFDIAGRSATDYYHVSLEQLFFKTLNTPIDERNEFKRETQKQLFPEADDRPQANLFRADNKTPYLNGGLFEAHDNDWYQDTALTFPDGFFTNLYNHFAQFNFTTDESTPEYEQVAIDPEMLGRVFESLLATQIDETGQQARKAKGAFYTPREIVSYMCRESLRNYLYDLRGEDDRYKKSVDDLLDRSDHEWASAGTNSLRDAVPKEYRTVIFEALDAVTILDPACGSGAFPMGMLQLLIKTYERLENRFDPYKTKLQIVQNSIFGVDIEPMAVEISRLRAWLSLIVDEEDSRAVAPLPNLDFKFVCANSLLPLDKELGMFSDNELHQKLKDLRTKYFNARSPKSKEKLRSEYHALTNTNVELFDNLRTRQLKSFDPFKNSHPASFFDADQMFGITTGFHIVIGNPPYGAKMSAADKKRYTTFYESAKTEAGGLRGSSDTYSLFTDMGLYHAIASTGILCYIVPLAFTSSESMSKLHSMLFKDCSLIQVSTYSNRPKKIFDNADQRVSIVLANKTGGSTSQLLTTGVLKRYASTSVRDIIANLHFVNSIEFVKTGRLPKIGSDIELHILRKLFNNQKTLGDYILKKKTDNVIYYRAAGGRYYHIIANYKTGSTQEKPLYLKDDLPSGVAGAMLSSNLYFWLSQAYSDNLHLKEYEITMLPIPEISDELKAALESVYKKYTDDLEKNAVIKNGNYKTIAEFKEYRARLSKPLIDQFDRLLQEAYGLTDEETAFLVNFEVTFRTDADEK
ncbi:MAG TPA: DNA methyltransferase [Candidatus Saccharimonadales bacterium]|nr:DNA methyltransferase [Candidatus Saccharimonadales bacterium]